MLLVAHKFSRAATRLALRADRAELVDLLRAWHVECSVGPAEPGGWVVVLIEAADPAPLASELSTTLGSVVVTAVVDDTDRRLELRAWQDGTPTADQDPSAIAAAIGRPPSEPVESEPDEQATDRLARLADRLGLPANLTDPLISSALVLHHGRLDDVRAVAAIAGPTRIVKGGRWHILVPVGQPGPGLGPRAAGYAAGLSTGTRQLATVMLANAGTDGCGYLLWRKGNPVDAHAWNLPWQSIPEPGPDDEHGNVDLLVRATGRPEQAMLMRALLRRRGEPAELLREFVTLADFPPQTVDLLLGRLPPDRLPGAELVERQPFATVLRGHLRNAPGPPAWLQVAGATIGALVWRRRRRSPGGERSRRRND